jgi:hypothetical protein
VTSSSTSRLAAAMLKPWPWRLPALPPEQPSVQGLHIVAESCDVAVQRHGQRQEHVSRSGHAPQTSGRTEIIGEGVPLAAAYREPSAELAIDDAGTAP